MAFILVACCMGALVACGVHGVKSFQKDVENDFINKFKEKYGSYSMLFKGMFILTCGPAVLGYWLISIVNQFIRWVLLLLFILYYLLFCTREYDN